MVVLRHFLFALPLISCLGPLQAATLERLSLDDMIAKSTAIVRGKIAGSWADYSGSSIYTHYKVQVTQRWKGAAQASEEFVIPGGRVGSVRQVCPGAPEVIDGKEYILFLWTSRAGRTYIIGFSQGLFEVPASGGLDGLAVRAASSEMMLAPQTGQVVPGERISISIKDLSTRISNTVSRGANN